MNKLKIHFENCYGIKSLEHELDFSEGNCIVVYAPNGTMKTSFTNTFRDLAEGKTPKDRFNPELKSVYVVKKSCDSKIKKEEIITISSESEKDNNYLLMENSRHNVLVAEKDLRKKYVKATMELSAAKDNLLKQLSKVMGYDNRKPGNTADDLIKDLDDDFQGIAVSMHEKLLKVDNYKDILLRYKKYPTYRELFKDNNIEQIEKIDRDILEDYIKTYNMLVEKSPYLHKDIFNHYNLEQVGEGLQNQSFFKANHSITLNPKNTSEKERKTLKGENAHTELSKLIKKEKDKVFQADELQEKLNKIDRELSKNKNNRGAREMLAKFPDLVKETMNMYSFKNNVWLFIFSQSNKELNNYMKVYEESKKKIALIVSKAKSETTKWEQIIDLFNSRFELPFDVDIINKTDAILEEETPLLEFNHKHKEKDKGRVSEKLLYDTLSRGERRAIFFLDVLYKLNIEESKQYDEPSLLIIDDIADSFDYENKYAIIQYLREFKEDYLKVFTNVQRYKMIILTHNFDFYRTVSKSLNIPYENLFVVRRSDDNKISFEKGQYIKNVFTEWLQRLHKDKMVIIATIPFARNMAEYLKYSANKVSYETCYDKLTSMLHVKSNTSNFTISDLINLYVEILNFNKDVIIDGKEQKVIGAVYDLADKIMKDDANIGINLEKKVVLSIAARLKAEKYMITKLECNPDDIKSNQTSKLLRQFKKRFAETEEKAIKIMERLCIITPEHIHLNAFMYEPLIDVGIHGLRNLYNDLINLTNLKAEHSL